MYGRKGDFAGAVTAYEKLFRTHAASKENNEVLFGYFDALLETKEYDKLEPKLDDLIAKGDRGAAAKAQILRGDVKTAQNLIEEAVLDYLRTAILFKSEKDSQPEALFKAAEGLEKLRDERAKDFYRRVVEEYPSSSYAPQSKATF